MDAGVGSIIDELDGSTLAVFTSDNGPEEGVGHARPFRGRKRSPYEGGTAVPCIFWMPGTIPANKREDVFVNGADFHATFLSAAQVAYPEEGRAWPPLQPSWDPAGRDQCTNHDLHAIDATPRHTHWLICAQAGTCRAPGSSTASTTGRR